MRSMEEVIRPGYTWALRAEKRRQRRKGFLCSKAPRYLIFRIREWGTTAGHGQEEAAIMGIFEGAYFAWVIVASVVRVAYTRRYRRARVARDHRRGLDAILSGLPGLGMFVLPIVYVLTDWFDFADYHLSLWAGDNSDERSANAVVAGRQSLATS